MFLIFVSLCAFMVAGVAAFFSVKGIGLLFGGAMIETMIMAGSLEAGKICVTGFLYRYWNQMPNFLRAYLLIAVVMLMAITSLGIYGFLSAAYQKSASEYGIFSQNVAILEKQKQFYEIERESIEKRIESLIESRQSHENNITKAIEGAASGKTSSSNMRRMQETSTKVIQDIGKDIEKEKEKFDDITENIKRLDLEILEIKTKSEMNKDILTFQFIADSLGTDLDTVVKWFILIIIIVFDPLAIGLVIAYNIIVMKQKEEKEILSKVIKNKNKIKDGFNHNENKDINIKVNDIEKEYHEVKSNENIKKEELDKLMKTVEELNKKVNTNNDNKFDEIKLAMSYFDFKNTVSELQDILNEIDNIKINKIDDKLVQTNIERIKNHLITMTQISDDNVYGEVIEDKKDEIIKEEVMKEEKEIKNFEDMMKDFEEKYKINENNKNSIKEDEYTKVQKNLEILRNEHKNKYAINPTVVS